MKAFRMKAVVQRVSRARVTVDSEVVSEIGPGLLTLLGIEHGDGRKQLEWLITKIVGLRIFDDEAGRMNLSLRDVSGQHLIVSQFTLLADCSKGLRPSFTAAASPEIARVLVDGAIAYSQQLGISTSGGRFQAHMNVEILNNGPVTIALETPRSG